MQARAARGYWVFCPPIGYRYERVSGHGKLLVRHEPLATIVKQALEAYASGRLEPPSEVQRFLDDQPEWPKGRQGGVHPSASPNCSHALSTPAISTIRNGN